jgi:hypothetical protein
MKNPRKADYGRIPARMLDFEFKSPREMMV